MITLLIGAYAYIVWLLTGINPLPHIHIELLLMAIFEVMLEGAFIFLIIQLIEYRRINK